MNSSSSSLRAVSSKSVPMASCRSRMAARCSHEAHGGARGAEGGGHCLTRERLGAQCAQAEQTPATQLGVGLMQRVPQVPQFSSEVW